MTESIFTFANFKLHIGYIFVSVSFVIPNEHSRTTGRAWIKFSENKDKLIIILHFLMKGQWHRQRKVKHVSGETDCLLMTRSYISPLHLKLSWIRLQHEKLSGKCDNYSVIMKPDQKSMSKAIYPSWSSIGTGVINQVSMLYHRILLKVKPARRQDLD